MTTPRIDFARLPLTVCVAGSRGFPHIDWVISFGRRLRPGTQLVHGDCPGSPDAYAERGIQTANAQARIAAPAGKDDPVVPYPSPRRFKANWKPQGRQGPTDKGAGPKRNAEMLEWVRQQGGVLVAFGMIDKETGRLTSGTADAVRNAKRLGVPSYLLILLLDGSVRYELDQFDAFVESIPTT